MKCDLQLPLELFAWSDAVGQSLQASAVGGGISMIKGNRLKGQYLHQLIERKCVLYGASRANMLIVARPNLSLGDRLSHVLLIDAPAASVSRLGKGSRSCRALYRLR